jgi:hypothetical protein
MKAFTLTLFIALALFTAPSWVMAQPVPGGNPSQNVSKAPANPNYKGIVQCDGVVTDTATQQKCDFIGLVNQIKYIINWMFYISVPLCVGMFAYAGGLYLAAGANLGKVGTAKDIFWNVVKGFALMLVAWLLIHTLLDFFVKPEFARLFI